uniref:Alpha-2-macroglobulin RAP C-terminal domain-containing protein n=1 Tax=Capra hircus TaxID=9925 RepID=A0A8C2RA00_CAPHI
ATLSPRGAGRLQAVVGLPRKRPGAVPPQGASGLVVRPLPPFGPAARGGTTTPTRQRGGAWWAGRARWAGRDLFFPAAPGALRLEAEDGVAEALVWAARGPAAAAAAAAAAPRAVGCCRPCREVLAGEERARAALEARARGGVPHGEAEPAVGEGPAVILAKYGLDGRKDSRVVSSNFVDHGPDDESLEDPRLEKLWHKAKTSGKFSSEELDKLWRELQHHKEKVQEYHALLETLGGTGESHENAIGPVDLSGVQAEALASRHAELKDRLRSIGQGFDRLRRVSHQGYGAETEFMEPRVLDLWDMAKSANFTEKELESFREELKHFEVKIEKHNHYQKQLEISHQKLKHVESFGDQEHVARNKERYALLEEKTKELGYKVKKHMQDLSSRISRCRVSVRPRRSGWTCVTLSRAAGASRGVEKAQSGASGGRKGWARGTAWVAGWAQGQVCVWVTGG